MKRTNEVTRQEGAAHSGAKEDRKKELREIVDLVLPDGLMIALAFLMIPVAIIPVVMELSPGVVDFFDFADYAIIAVFVVEYLLKAALARDVKKHVLNPWHLLDLPDHRGAGRRLPARQHAGSGAVVPSAAASASGKDCSHRRQDGQEDIQSGCHGAGDSGSACDGDQSDGQRSEQRSRERLDGGFEGLCGQSDAHLGGCLSGVGVRLRSPQRCPRRTTDSAGD